MWHDMVYDRGVRDLGPPNRPHQVFGRLHRLGYYSEGPGCSAHNAIFTKENWASLVDVHAKLRLLIDSGVVSACHLKTYPETILPFPAQHFAH